MFQGIPQEGLRLLDELPALDKDGFAARSRAYRDQLQGPIKAFVEALGPALQARISPAIRFAARTHGSISPINNDVRFNPEAPVYKDHVLLRFWEGAEKKAAPTLWVRLTSSDVGFASGAQFADVERWRRAVDAHGATLADALEALSSETDATVVGVGLKRVPRGFPSDHPRGDLLKHKWLQARWSRRLDPAESGAALVATCVGELERAAPVHRWLVRHLEDG